MSINVRPVSDRIVIRKLEEKENKVGDIVIPQTVKEAPREAEVIATGPGRQEGGGKRIPVGVSVGDIVLIDKYTGFDIRVDGKDYHMIREDEILAIVDQEK